MIFVDDLERCRPPRAVDICEVASQLLGHPNVMTVLIADMATIATSAEIKYAQLEHVHASSAESLAPGSPPGSYGRLYLQKIVQIQFNLPASPTQSMPGLLRETFRRSPSQDPIKHLLRRLLKVLSGPPAYLLLIVVLTGLFFKFFTVPNDSASSSNSSGSPIAALVLSSLLLLFISPIGDAILLPFKRLVQDYRAFYAKQAQRQIDEDVRDAMAAGAETVEDVLTALIGDGLEPQRQELARQRAQRMLADESARRKQAESKITEHLPALPRSAKRLFNYLRVLLVVAEHKHMFGGSPRLEAKHLGKWAVLLERWPELASALTADPGRLADLEAATSIEDLSMRLGPAIPASFASQDLLAFLKSPTKLAPVTERLVYFQPHTSGEDVADQPDELLKVATSISPPSKG